MYDSEILAAAEPYLREFAVEVWQTEVAHSERYEILIYQIRSQPRRSSLQLPYYVYNSWWILISSKFPLFEFLETFSASSGGGTK